MLSFHSIKGDVHACTIISFLHMLAKWSPTKALMKPSQCTPDLSCHCFKRTHLFTSVVDSYSVSMGAAMDEMRCK